MGTEFSLNRRSFLACAAGASLTAMAPAVLRGAERKIKLGLIGCGGRGTWIMDLFHQHGGYEMHACADYFADQSKAFGDKFGIPAERQFSTLSGYKKLIESGVDAVAVLSPPYFHPEQAAAAVEAGKHVYLAKPIAVDVPGCKSIEQSGAEATKKKQCFLVDFQTRTDPFFIEAIKRVHNGDLGKYAFGESMYHAEIPWTAHMESLSKEPNNPEVKLRAWGMNRMLSGDIITEQNIHTLDVMSWIMDTPPLYATGTGGQKVRMVGDCYDHFACLYQYPDNVGVTFSSRQFPGHGTQPSGIINRMMGSEGVLEAQYFGHVILRGKKFYRGGNVDNLYGEGALRNIATFHKNIMEADYTNDTVPPSVRSNLVTILGRTAGYNNVKVTWKELVHSPVSLEYDMKGLKR